jgi:DNA-binding PadR family transcriptional regulator
MKLPEITSLQFLALSILMEGECSGRKLRERLTAFGHRTSTPAFYQFMHRAEEAGFAEGRYEQKVVGGQIIKERLYTATSSGIRVCEDFRTFAASRGRLGLQGA